MGAAACWVGPVAWELAWRGEEETQSGRKTVGGSAVHREAECQEGWEFWGGRAPTRPGHVGLEEAAGAGGSGRGLGCLCWGGVWG